MATYKGIQGYSVQKLSSDPTASEAVGQLWYNSSTGKFKVGVQAAGAWASGGNLNTARNVPGQGELRQQRSVLEEMSLLLLIKQKLMMVQVGQK